MHVGLTAPLVTTASRRGGSSAEAIHISQPDAGDQAALALLRDHIRNHFPGVLDPVDQVGYYALVHAGWRLKGQHPKYPPPGCPWRKAFWGE